MAASTLKSESSSPLIEIPHATNSWKLEHLLSLNISTLFSTTTHPFQILDILLSKTTPRKIGKNAELDLRICKLSQNIKKTIAFQLLNYSLDDILQTMTNKDIDMMLRTPNAWSLECENEDNFRDQFQSSGAEFSEGLLYLMECFAEKNNVSEYTYQNLFVNFLRLFGIKCQFAPVIPTKDMTVRKRKSSGTPDIIANFWKKEEGCTKCDLKTLFVGKVIKDERNSGSLMKKTRLSDSNPAISQIPDSLLGQHGADLLMYVQTSVVEGSIIGIMVEKTHVSFSKLTVTDKQLKQISEGKTNFNPECAPELICTRAYDYMKKEDRDYLIEPFVKLGLLQNEGNKYF